MQKATSTKRVKFVNIKGTDFLTTLKSRVDQYFEENGISRNANGWMVLKTIAMLTMLLGPYALILFLEMPLWTMWVLALIMGLGKAGIGLSELAFSGIQIRAASRSPRFIGIQIPFSNTLIT